MRFRNVGGKWVKETELQFMKIGFDAYLMVNVTVACLLGDKGINGKLDMGPKGRDNPNVPQYEHIKVLSAKNSNAAPCMTI